MAAHSFNVAVGDQVFVGTSVEEVGAVQHVTRDHVMIYIENAGPFRIDGPEVIATHDGKLVLDPNKLAPALTHAIANAHAGETEE
jgi:hypothetical protein